MCGIAGAFAYGKNAAPLQESALTRTRDAMASRGPDGAGLWLAGDGMVGLAHRRLSIIDLTDAGAQPMASEDGRLTVVFNGEIYNHRQLRALLVRQGYHFRSQSDTEVLLHLYDLKGAEMVRDLRGMFAFALWDRKRRGLFLARDPFGIKPLYHADDGVTYRFASQVKALLAGGEVDTAADPAGHVGFFLWGNVPHPHTLYRGIRELPAGSTLWIDSRGPRAVQSFCRIPEELAGGIEAECAGALTPGVSRTTPLPGAERIDRQELRERLRGALLDSVRHHLVSDVPVSLFLSSGLDSATLAGLVSEVQSRRLRTVTLAFREYQGSPRDESPLAERIAEQYGMEQQTCWIDRREFQADLHSILAAMDQPTVDGINTYFVSKVAAAQGVKVALSGVGGDELFGGYSSFREIPMLVSCLAPARYVPALARTVRLLTASVLKSRTPPKYAGLLEYGGTYSGAYLLRRSLFMPWELPGLLDGEMVREGWRELQPLLRLDETLRGIRGAHRRVSALELTWYLRHQLLRDADWAGMAHSLEIRTPLVDVELLRRVAPLFAHKPHPTKLDMASTPATLLPEEVLRRPKTGFGVPVHEWLQRHRAGPDRGLRGWSRVVYRAFVDPSGSGPGGAPSHSARSRAPEVAGIS